MPKAKKKKVLQEAIKDGSQSNAFRKAHDTSHAIAEARALFWQQVCIDFVINHIFAGNTLKIIFLITP